MEQTYCGLHARRSVSLLSCHAERSEASTLGFLTAFGMTEKAFGMTEKMHETTERRFACPTCHAERSEASTLGFLTALGMTGKSVRDNAKKCTE